MYDQLGAWDFVGLENPPNNQTIEYFVVRVANISKLVEIAIEEVHCDLRTKELYIPINKFPRE